MNKLKTLRQAGLVPGWPPPRGGGREEAKEWYAMAFVMAVLTIHFIVKAIFNTKQEKKIKAGKNESSDVKHPAEFLLR